MRRHGRHAALMLLALAGVLAALAPGASAAPATYLLAVGDSVPYGLGNANTSYVDVLAQRLQVVRPGLTAVNYSCSGAESADLVGPAPSACQGAAQRSPHTGSQLDAALAFLAAHPGEVSPIVVTAGGNDLLHNLDLDAMQANVAQIASALRAAAPAADLVVTGYGDPLSHGKPGQAARYATHAAFEDRLRTAATGAGATFVDPHPLFNSPPAAQDAAICTYMRMCVANDIHPTPAGHGAYADLVWDALDYDSLRPPIRTPADPPFGPGQTATTSDPLLGTPSTKGTPVTEPVGEVLGARASSPLKLGTVRLAGDRRSLRVWVRCASDRPRTCRVRVVARHGATRLGRAETKLRPGRSTTLKIRLHRRLARGATLRVAAYIGDAKSPATQLSAR
ncbi:MAG: SGNH/GDSL hydrolase family protein [Solirubrobacteraceae bacterium]|nr:SGNH/GDSL hydrolase family protein [Solirubrobacteraceae bacterium]